MKRIRRISIYDKFLNLPYGIYRKIKGQGNLLEEKIIIYHNKGHRCGISANFLMGANFFCISPIECFSFSPLTRRISVYNYKNDLFKQDEGDDNIERQVYNATFSASKLFDVVYCHKLETRIIPKFLKFQFQIK